MKKDLARIIRKPILKIGFEADKEKGHCFACGLDSTFAYAEIITDELAEQWEIGSKDRHAFSSRESRQCENCGATYRNRQVGRMLCEEYGKNIKCAKDLIGDPYFQKLQIAEINAVGGLHQFLIRHPNMYYSEFEPDDKKIRSENLHNLSYYSNSFDLVITSETLEHIPNYKQALKEIRRILKPGGQHIFTVPIIWARKTRSRAKLKNSTKKINYILKPSYHGLAQSDNLVWTEFGYDFLDILESSGFKTKLLYYNLLTLMTQVVCLSHRR